MVHVALFAASAFTTLITVGVMALIPLTWVAARLTGHNSAALGFDLRARRLLQFCAGLALGAAMVLTVCLMFRLFSPFHWEPNPKAASAVLITGLTFYFKSSLLEELLFRGYCFLRLREWLGVPTTQALIAIAFALYHVANVGMPLVPALLLPGVASLLFGYAFLRSEGVILPVAMHAAWNYTQEQLGISSGRNQPGFWTIVREPGADPVPSLAGYAMLLLTLFLAALVIRYCTGPKSTKN